MPHLSTNYCTNGSYVIFIVIIMLKIFDLKKNPKNIRSIARLYCRRGEKFRAKKEREKKRKTRVLQWRAERWKGLINRDGDNYPWTVQISFA